MKVLVIDDTSYIRKRVTAILQDYGINEVLDANNGATALDLANSHNDINLVLLDIHMPEMNGVQVLTELKKMPHMKAVPVVMVTSASEKEWVVKSIRAGAVGYLVKPFEKADLYEKIKTFISPRANGPTGAPLQK